VSEAPGAPAAIDALRRGEVVALLDDSGVGHLVCDAAAARAEDVVAMLDAGGGIFSVVVSTRRCAELRLPEQEGRGSTGRRIAVSVDAREGTTTGISAEERALTARVVADPATRPSDLVVPGHVPPLIAADAGVLVAREAPEAALDVVRLAGGTAAAICAILDEDGATASPAAVRDRAAARGLPSVTITEIATRRLAAERPLRAVGRRRVVTHQGSFINEVTGESHAALVRGAVEGRAEVPVALRCSSPVDDLLASLEPSGESSLAQTLRRFARAEVGVLVHLRDAGAEDPRALDLTAATLAELAPASVLPLDPALAAPLRERGVEVARPRSAPRRRTRPTDGCTGFDYEVDTAI
jgi:3,4-dihydroxy 2-butanone 4-phosphate synthase/GTP cyclohydrolase II